MFETNIHTFATSRLLRGSSAPHVAATKNYTLSQGGPLSYLLPFPLKYILFLILVSEYTELH